ncbi:MAG: rhamnogalacturonan acetylesterase [Pontiellaceae bacterium]|nr:rhamnogalacturonan acetylesterase [Pontiellaceae bacterium]MBN2784101.1 rhamnogalacturonan acetylesterase [Pontiellaceae bacterium]
MKRNLARLFLLAPVLAMTACAAMPKGEHFYFGEGRLPNGFTRVTDRSDYPADRGFGWLNGHDNHFAVELPEGNYTVTVAYTSPEAAAAATVKAEARRLMLLKQENSGEKIRSFTVNIRRPEIKGGGRVKLNKRETDPEMVAHWDNLLTLEFLPDVKDVAGISIEPVPEAITVYIAGDSTVTDQRAEPWSGWGQALPSFFEPGVAVANYAESGRALFSFLWEKRLEKILSEIKPGDYLFIQFGHNDQKDKREGAGPFTTYKQELEQYIAAVEAKEAHAVLVTPMERRRWNGGKPTETLTDYAAAIRQVGAEKKVPVIDLHAMSLRFYAALGEADSTKAFVHYPANSFPNQDKALKDDTHHNVYGAYELARCVVEGIKSEVPELAKKLRSDVGTFDPSKPDAPESLDIPASSDAGAETPEGS